MRNQVLLLLAFLLPAALPANAQELIGSYVAFIGEDDLYNSDGMRLSEPAQILRQDRANVHKFGISQPGDEGDPFFGSVRNRAAMETMVRNGSIDRQAWRNIVNGGTTVFVRIYGSRGVGRFLNITAVR